MNKKKNPIRWLALLLVCIMVLAMASCGKTGTGGNGESAAPSSGSSDTGTNKPEPSSGTSTNADRPLNIAIAEDHGTMLPQAASGTGGMISVIRAIYEPLYFQKADGSFEYILATGMDSLADDHYTLHLREGVKFSNGNVFNAEDVMFTMGLYNGHPRHGMMVGWIDFDKTKVVDDYTIDLWLTKYSLIQFPALASMYIHDKESYNEQELALNPITTGPYKVTDYVVNSHIFLQARDDYWGDTPLIKTIKFTFMNEDAQRVNALTTGEADVAKVPMKDVEYVESLGDYNARISYLAQADCAYFNMSPGAPLESLEARQAVMMAIDRQAIIDVVYVGKSSAPKWPVSEYNIDYQPDRMANMDPVYATGYNKEEAKKLAESSGLVGKTVRIAVNGQSSYVTMAQMIQYDLEQIGVNSTILNFDQATYFSTLMDASNFDIGLYFIANTIGSAADLFTNYPQFFQLGWSGPERDDYLALGNKALETKDDKARGEILYEMASRFTKINIWFPLCETANINAVNKGLQGVEYYLDGGASYNKWYWAS